MGAIKTFEEIEAWQKARELARAVYACSKAGAFAKDFNLRDQMRRAAVSVMSNIAEGFERGGRVEFRQFLSIAKGSAGEVHAQLYVALDQGYITEQEFKELQELLVATERLLGAFMKYLKNSDFQGPKYWRREEP
jgi:four helix bundle protein